MGRKRRLDKETIATVLTELHRLYPDAGPELNFTNPFELLIATILSAQCTDVRVNIVTEKLFAKYPTAKDYLSISEEELGKEIKSCGLYQSKAKNILKTCRILVEDWESVIPNTREALVELPGVGRKTANVVLSNAFDVPAIAVDTHVFRVSNRLGIANAKTVEKTEIQLMDRIPEHMWSQGHHLFIFHGRRVCKSRKPDCSNCTLNEMCLYFKYEVNNLK